MYCRFNSFSTFYVYYKGKTPVFINLQFLLLLSEKGLSLESCLAIRELIAYKPAAYKKTKSIRWVIKLGLISYLIKIDILQNNG